MTVKELICLLKKLPGETEVGIATAPTVTGWVNGVKGISTDQKGRAVVWATDETLDLVEVDLGWID